MNKKVLEQLAGALKFDAELLAKSLSSENEDEKIELPKLFTESDVNSIKENLGKERYDAGATASREMTLKELSDLAGFNERVKDKEAFVSKFKEQILADASVEPNKKVDDLQASLEKLQGVVSQKDQEIVDLQQGFKQKEVKFKASSLIEVPENIGLSKDEAISLFFMNHEIKDDGIYKNGEKLKDSVENSLSLEDAVKGFVSEKGWDKEPTPRGRGGGSGSNNPHSTTPTSLDEFEKYAKEKGLTVGSQDYNSALHEMAKENPAILN